MDRRARADERSGRLRHGEADPGRDGHHPAVALGLLGAVLGTADRAGIDATFRAQVHELLAPDRAVIVLLASTLTEEAFVTAMTPYGGRALRISLSAGAERELAHEPAGNLAS